MYSRILQGEFRRGLCPLDPRTRGSTPGISSHQGLCPWTPATFLKKG